MISKKFTISFLLLLHAGFCLAQSNTVPSREHLLMDFGWRFAYGHPYDAKKDFDNGTSYFSYYAKAGYGDGAAAAKFDDRYWRQLNLPHDWAVEEGFSAKASFSHGFKTVGRAFPETSVGWYRKNFTIPASDLGRHISLAFDGVFRASIVWVNGHYLGSEPSGYLPFEYDITDYLNYGGDNVVSVRVDATMEEGWFYEGAGIYRHVWLNKTAALHVATDGSFVIPQMIGAKADIHAGIRVKNDGITTANFDMVNKIFDDTGKELATTIEKNRLVKPFEEVEFSTVLPLQNPRRWDVDDPYLYKLQTTLVQEGKVVDEYTTNFGVRTLRWDAAEGFFLNGRHLKIQGTNNHQDAAGVGAAMPDALHLFRIKTLKSFGVNAYRCSHNPPTPELLDACDRLGMLVIDENRLMGTNDYHLSSVKRMMLRDRNHPSIISWSIGNEEWAIENNSTGERIAQTMQAFVKSLDTSRAVTAAFSGGITAGLSGVMDLIGINYVMNKNTDVQHKKFPAQFSWGTEEGSTVATRGEYITNNARHYRAAYDEPQNKTSLSLEEGWKWYAQRPYLGGMFIWTGFDYRGEPSPYGWPSVTSLFGMVDLCGFPKDNVYYLKSWWMSSPIVHLLPHWNWPGKEGQQISVWAYSNCEEVELFLNKKSLGRKPMPRNGHLEWTVAYQPGTLEAMGYNGGKRLVTDKVQTTGDAKAMRITADRTSIKADNEDLSMVTVEVVDKDGLHIPTASHEVSFNLQGPGKMIGVGNGDPTSLEKDKFLPTIQTIKMEGLKEKKVAHIKVMNEIAADYNDATWPIAFTDDRMPAFGDSVKALVYRGYFTLPKLRGNETITLFYKSIGQEQIIYINGKSICAQLSQSATGNEFILTPSQLQEGRNSIAIAATPLLKKQPWDNINTDPGLFQITTPADGWQRRLFNGLSQVIVQSTGEPGEIILTATSKGLLPAVIKISTVKTALRPSVPAH